MSDKHVYICTIYYVTEHKRFLRKPSELRDYEELGFMYGTKDEVTSRIKAMTDTGTRCVQTNFNWNDEIILRSDFSMRVLDGKVTFEELKNGLKAEDFISYCKDKVLPLEMILK